MIKAEDICSLPKVLEINEQYKALVDRWMCTTDCPCYSGVNNETMQMWVKYTNTVLAPHQRNSDVKILMLDNVETFPLKWTDVKGEARHTFK